MKTHQNNQPLQSIYEAYVQQLLQQLHEPLSLLQVVSTLAERLGKMQEVIITAWHEPTKKLNTSIIRLELGAEAMEIYHYQQLGSNGARSKKYCYFQEGKLVHTQLLPHREEVPQSTLFLLSSTEYLLLPSNSEPSLTGNGVEPAVAASIISEDAKTSSSLPLHRAFTAMVEQYRDAGNDIHKLYRAIRNMNEAMDAVPGARMQEWDRGDATQEVTVVRVTAGEEAIETHHCHLAKGGKPMVKKYRYYRKGVLVEKAAFAYTEEFEKRLAALGTRLFAEEKQRKAG